LARAIAAQPAPNAVAAASLTVVFTISRRLGRWIMRRLLDVAPLIARQFWLRLGSRSKPPQSRAVPDQLSFIWRPPGLGSKAIF
jgi:hypothetical protein